MIASMERRGRKRVRGQGLSEFTVYLDHEEPLEGCLVDISESGLQFQMTAAISDALIGAVLPGMLNGPHLDDALHFDGRILWIRNHGPAGFAGIEFTQPIDLPPALLAISMSGD
jgi:hypothetical protein